MDKLILISFILLGINSHARAQDKFACPTSCRCSSRLLEPDLSEEDVEVTDSRPIYVNTTDCSNLGLSRLPNLSLYVNEINLAGNSLTTLKFSDLMADLKSMRCRKIVSVNVSHNMLEEIRLDTTDYGCNSYLLTLDLDFNLLSTLKWIPKFKELAVISAEHNRLTNVDYLSLPKAEVVLLSFNDISSFKIDLKGNLPSIKHLFLRNNPLETVPRLASNTLIVLDLSYCAISSIEPNAFSQLKKLKILFLAGNYLQNMDSRVLSTVPSLIVVVLNDNPWSCDCESAEFRSIYGYIEKTSSLEKLKCANGESWEDAGCQADIDGNSSSSESGPSTTTIVLIVVIVLGVIAAAGWYVYYKQTMTMRGAPEIREGYVLAPTSANSTTTTTAAKQERPLANQQV